MTIINQLQPEIIYRNQNVFMPTKTGKKTLKKKPVYAFNNKFYIKSSKVASFSYIQLQGVLKDFFEVKSITLEGTYWHKI